MSEKADTMGASPVNDELAVGFDAGFEHRFVFLQRTGQTFLVLIVVLALSGLLGRGPLSHAAMRTPDGAVSVDYEPVARYGTETQVTLHIQAPTASTVQVAFDTKMIEPMGLQTILPRPLSETADGAGIKARFAAVPATEKGRDMLIRLYLKPTVVGPVTLHADLQGAPPLRWRQMILP